MNKEIWKDIQGYEGLYQVSNLGNVRNIKYDRILKPYYSFGYLRYGLSKNDIRINYYAHVLVAIAFIQNDDPINKIQVNHINEIKDDNRVENLEWCTPSYNVNYGTRNSRASLKVKGVPRSEEVKNKIRQTIKNKYVKSNN